jgi:hypothetical protein
LVDTSLDTVWAKPGPKQTLQNTTMRESDESQHMVDG